MTIGVLLINLGTPQAATKAAVKNFLREFLNDPRVIDLPYIIRKILVNLFIIPFRIKTATQAYQKIWQAEGSPLFINSYNLQNALAAKLEAEYQVVLAMRYGEPSLQKALQQLQACIKIIVIPLFPQYSSAATGSALAKFFAVISAQPNIPAITTINHFFDNAGYIQCYAQLITENMQVKPDKLIFSYHGLPQRQNYQCYREQCVATSQLIANQLQLSENQYCTTFQSRLGKTRWIEPYTDVMLTQLSQQGINNVMLVCPSFVTDCLETLEEIGIRARASWQALGGKNFTLVPALNTMPAWVDALAQLVLHQNGM